MNNESYCPYCLCFIGTDPLKHEIDRIPFTKITVENSFKENSEIPLTLEDVGDVDSWQLLVLTTKQCPMCNALIEKHTDDCDQMYCVLCKTVWSWKSKKIIKNNTDIHNSYYFDRLCTIDRSIPQFENPMYSYVMNKIIKCLQILDRTYEMFTVGLFENRVAYIGERINSHEFSNEIFEIYKTRDRNLAIKSVLENFVLIATSDNFDGVKLIHHDRLRAVDEKYSLSPLKLPYC